MWNATMKTTVVAMALIGLGTGCDLESAVQGLTGGGDPTEDVDTLEEPNEPGEVDEDALLECDNTLEACLDGVYADADDDEALIDDEIACFETHEECIGDHWDWWTDEEPDDIDEDDLLECDNELEACLDDVFASDEAFIEDEIACFEAHEECIGDQDWWMDEAEECDLELEDCLEDLYTDPSITEEDLVYGEDECFERFETCIDEHHDTWPDEPYDEGICEELVELCFDSGVEPELCEEVFIDCIEQNECEVFEDDDDLEDDEEE